MRVSVFEAEPEMNFENGEAVEDKINPSVVFTIGLSLYPTAVNYMAGGASSANYGHWTNWLVAIITLAIVTFLNHFTKGFVKLASILIGIICGYIIAACFGMIDFSSVTQASMFQVPQFMHFGMKFEFSAILTFIILFTINFDSSYRGFFCNNIWRS